MRTILGTLYRALSSLALSCVLLFLVGLLTWLGTLEQVDSGLFEVQRKYFESFFLVHDFGPVALPLPGANLVLSLLFVNLALGGVVRLRRGWSTAGILVTHLGILLLLLSGFVKLYFSHDGHVTLYENESASHFESYYRWEIAISEPTGGGGVREHLVPQERFADAVGPRAAVLTSGELPFDLEVHHFMANARPRPKGPMFEVAVPVVDGVYLEEGARFAQAEANVAGAYVTVVDEAGGSRTEGILWGRDAAPFSFEAGGRVWAVDLRRERYPMPFTVRLEKFTKEDHPRMAMAKAFSSDVTVLEGESERPVKISMNEPLRDKGLVLYQASWGPADAGPGDPLFSTLSVVQNPADQYPLYACIVIAAGLLMHFSRKLVRYVRSENRKVLGAAGAARVAARAAGLGGLVLALAAPADAQATRPAPWSEEAVALAESLPVQDGGRIKPLHTYAGFTLLRFNGKRSVKTPAGERLSPVEWLLDTLFWPEQASGYPVFIVQNSEVIEAIGLSTEGKKRRDRWSFDELRPAVPRLFELARQLDGIEQKERTAVQQQLVLLAGNVSSYAQLLTHMDFARAALPVGSSPELRAILGERETVSYGEALAELGALRALFERLSAEQATGSPAYRDAARLLRALSGLADGTQSLALIPPSGGEAGEAWLTPADLLMEAFEQGRPGDEHRALLGDLEGLARARGEPGAFERDLADFHARVDALAEARGETAKLGLELAYYKSKVLDYAHYLFVLSFLTMAFMWLRPRGRLLYGATWAAVGGGTLLLAAAITMRCMIRGRPPVSTLYETVLFVTATGALTALVAEAINRQRLALSAAAVLGTIGLFVANGYEMLDKRDTMPSLVAVLDTNFWLATHVTSITLGYSAGMLAALLASVYLLAKPFASRLDPGLFRSLGRMVYGALCFGLIFSTVGTILGGIWANDSWGRFWGWDPKENGALLIVVSQILILHLRMGGYLREHGVCMAAALGGTVIAFSWWGVNLLGVGLHSYGFTSGISRALWIYYGLQWGVVGVGGVAWLLQRRGLPRPAPGRRPAPELRGAGGKVAVGS